MNLSGLLAVKWNMSLKLARMRYLRTVLRRFGVMIVTTVGCCDQGLIASQEVDLRAKRVEGIKSCAHGPHEPCPHGRV